MPNPPLFIGLSGVQLAILIVIVVLALCIAFALGVVFSQRNQASTDFSSAQGSEPLLPETPKKGLSVQKEGDSGFGDRFRAQRSPNSEPRFLPGVEMEEVSDDASSIKYTIQIGAYSVLSNAQEALDEVRELHWIKKNKHPGWIQKSHDVSMYFIWVGEFGTLEDALENAPEFQTHLQLSDLPVVKQFRNRPSIE